MSINAVFIPLDERRKFFFFFLHYKRKRGSRKRLYEFGPKSFRRMGLSRSTPVLEFWYARSLMPRKGMSTGTRITDGSQAHLVFRSHHVVCMWATQVFRYSAEKELWLARIIECHKSCYQDAYAQGPDDVVSVDGSGRDAGSRFCKPRVARHERSTHVLLGGVAIQTVVSCTFGLGGVSSLPPPTDETNYLLAGKRLRHRVRVCPMESASLIRNVRPMYVGDELTNGTGGGSKDARNTWKTTLKPRQRD